MELIKNELSGTLVLHVYQDIQNRMFDQHMYYVEEWITLKERYKLQLISDRVTDLHSVQYYENNIVTRNRTTAGWIKYKLIKIDGLKPSEIKIYRTNDN